MDKGFFLFEASSNVSVISEIEEEFCKTNYGKVKFSENEIYWMGYLYRYWCYTYGKMYNPTQFAKKSSFLQQKSNCFAKYFVP